MQRGLPVCLALCALSLLSCGKQQERLSYDKAQASYAAGVLAHVNGNYLEAILSLTEAEKCMPESVNPAFKIALYQELAATSTAAGVFEDGKRYADSAEAYALRIGDTLRAEEARRTRALALEYLCRSRENRQPILQAQRKQLAEQNAQLERQARRQQGTFAAVAGILLLLLLAILLYFRRRNRMLMQEKESLLETCRALTAHTTEPQDAQEALRQRYAELCRMHQLDRIAETLLFSHEADPRLYQEMKKAVKDIRLDAESQQAFERMIDHSLDDAMAHFRETFPGRKPSFYQFAGYLFAGFNAATISTLLYDMAKDRIYVKKYQLKQLIAKTETPYQQQFLQLIR